MAGDFKMHRAAAGPGRPGADIVPLGGRAKRPAGRARLAARSEAEARKPGAPADSSPPAAVEEIGGPKGPEPTRYGDWERNGICYDF